MAIGWWRVHGHISGVNELNSAESL